MLDRRYRPGVRWTELRLLTVAIVLLIVGLVSADVALATERLISLGSVRPGFAPAVLLIGVTAVWAWTRMAASELLLPPIALLLCIGIVLIQRLQGDIGPPGSALAGLSSRHRLYAGMAILTLFAVGRWFPLWKAVRRYKYLIMAASLLLMIVTMLFGTERYGAKLWLEAGPLSIQTSEIIKLGLVLFLAAYLHEKGDLLGRTWYVGILRLPPVPTLIPLLAVLAISVGIVVVLNDLGTALLLFGITLAMFYVATGNGWYVGVGLAAFGASSWLAYQLFDRVGIRVANWLDPWSDPFDAGYQQIQSDYALAAGGMLGTGLGRGQPEAIPAVHTDFVLSALMEETGFVGVSTVVACNIILLALGLKIALTTPILYERLIAVGLSATLGLQAIIITGGVLRIMPLTGVTLPFVSAGGSSLIANALAAGMLVNLSHRVCRRETVL